MFLNVCKETFHISHACITQKVKRFWNVKPSTYCFQMWTKILTDFQICISVHLISIYFDSPQLGIQWKQIVYIFRLLVRRYAQFLSFRKGSGNSFSTRFCEGFFNKNVCLSDCLIVITSWDIAQYVYCKYLIARLWYYNYEITVSLSF